MTDEIVAIKCMDFRSQPKKDMLLSEIKVMQQYRQENLVNYIEVLFSKFVYSRRILSYFVLFIEFSNRQRRPLGSDGLFGRWMFDGRRY